MDAKARPGPLDPERVARARAVMEKGARRRWWRRVGNKRRGSRYVDANGAPVTDEAHLERIRKLAIPPGWLDARINPRPNSRLQAVGVDTGGRVQYRYHAVFAARQQERKYAKIERFGENLPRLRERANEDIAREGYPRERVLAVVIRLINDLYFRVGSEESVRRYRTYGVTTLRNSHLRIEPDGKLVFCFVGKHHIRHRRFMVDSELANLMEEIKAIGGPKLFEYLDESGMAKPLKPQDVNGYIKAAMGPEYSAKDFRTWHGTLLAAQELARLGLPENEQKAKKNIALAVRNVADDLGNTPSVCRACYIHPVVFERYQQGLTLEQFRVKGRRRIAFRQAGYTPEEQALLGLLRADHACAPPVNRNATLTQAA